MAVSTPSLLTSGSDTSDTTSSTSASFSPTANALIMVAMATVENPHTVDSISDTFGGLSWTQIDSPVGSDGRHCTFFFANAGASPGSGTVTITYNVAVAKAAWVIAEVTGHNQAAPVSEQGIANGSGSTLGVTLADFATGNLIIGAIMDHGNQDIASGSGETEIAEAESGGTTAARAQMQFGTDTTTNWTNLDNRMNKAVAVEIAQAVVVSREGRWYAIGILGS